MSISLTSFEHNEKLEKTFSWTTEITDRNIEGWQVLSKVFDLYGNRKFALNARVYRPKLNIKHIECVLKLTLIKYEKSLPTLEIVEVRLRFVKQSVVELVFENKSDDPNNCIFQESDISVPQITNLYSTQTFDCLVKIIYKVPHLQVAHSKFLSKNFDALLKTENYADFVIEVGDVTLKTHKNILSCRSKVLAKMIEADMLEKKTNKVVLSNWDIGVVKEMLNYVYTGGCDVSIDIAHELFKLAHYLDIAGLQEGTKQFMLFHIDMKNIADILELTVSDDYKMEKLREKAISFVSNNSYECSRNPKIIDHLCNHLSLDNITIAQEISKQYHHENLSLCAMKFVRENYKQVLKNWQIKSYLEKKGDLLLKILENSLDYYASPQEDD